MSKLTYSNLTKNNLSKQIHLKLGISSHYSKIIIDDLIQTLKSLIKKNKLVIKNFGSFKTLNKKERLGRNPKNKKIYKITSRRSISFSASKNLNGKLKNI